MALLDWELQAAEGVAFHCLVLGLSIRGEGTVRLTLSKVLIPEVKFPGGKARTGPSQTLG